MTNFIIIALLVVLVIKSFWENILDIRDRFTTWRENRRSEAEADDDKKSAFRGPLTVLAYAVVVIVILVLAVLAYKFAAGIPIFGSPQATEAVTSALPS